MQGSFERCSSFGHARPGGIWRDGFEELNWVAYDRLLLLGERSPIFGPPPSNPNLWKIIFRSDSTRSCATIEISICTLQVL